MDIDGLSEKTAGQLYDTCGVRVPSDLYGLSPMDLLSLEGFKEKKAMNLLAALEKSKQCDLDAFLFALGIPNIGRQASRLICAKYTTAEELEKLSAAELTSIDGIGEVLANDYVKFFADEKNLREFRDLLAELEIEESAAVNSESAIAGKTFVITGSVHIWKNRKELQAYIEQNGGKAANSVSSKTDYLINNDNTSNSTKNKTAKELGIPIITEEEFQALISG
jgi:DNA ligase (NAD+)